MDKTIGRQLLTVGLLYEDARADELAVKFFEPALARGQHPEACLALARNAYKATDTARAREAHALGVGCYKIHRRRAASAQVFVGCVVHLTRRTR